MSPYTRPETVLRRADELLAVNQKGAALAALSEVFSSKRFRSTPPALIEPIMMRFVELCVDLRKGRVAKDGLHMYKNAQQTTAASLEHVLDKFLNMSRSKLNDAITQWDSESPSGSQESAISAVVEDLDAVQTPENLLRSAFESSDDSAAANSASAGNNAANLNTVTPWLRFLWEAYRTSLDIVRNNTRFELLYHRLCLETFAFCKRFQRRTEFRRLCEMLRSHLASSQKSPNAHVVNLNDSETLERHLDLRFEQLNTAVDLELWQEAFRTMEDIHGVLSRSKGSTAKFVSSMVSYYKKMAQVFAVGKNYRLLHAAALVKAYSLVTGKNGAVSRDGNGSAQGADSSDDDETASLATQAVLAVLSVPVGSEQIAFALSSSVANSAPSAANASAAALTVVTGNSAGDEVRVKLTRLASILGLGQIPTRASLLNEIVHRGALKKVPASVSQLYTQLELSFHPITSVRAIEPILNELSSAYPSYIQPLKTVVVGKIIQHVAKSYSALRLSRISRWCHFASESDLETRRRVEAQLVEACRLGDVDARIDHRSDLVQLESAPIFEPDVPSGPLLAAALRSSTSTGSDASSATKGAAQGLNAPVYSPGTPAAVLGKPQEAVPGTYKSIDTIVRTYVPNMASVLYAAVDQMPTASDSASTSERPLDLAASRAQETLEMAHKTLSEQSAALRRRNLIIAKRAERARKAIEAQDAEAAKQRSALAKQRAEREQARLREEAQRREEERQRQTIEKVKHEQALLLAERLRKDGGIDIDTSIKENLDQDKIKRLQFDRDAKEQQVLASKVEAVVKRTDHYERACREAEQPLLKEDEKRQAERAESLHKVIYERKLEEFKDRKAHAKAIRKTLEPLMPDISAFIKETEKDARAAYEKKVAKANARIAQQKVEYRKEVLEKREAERKAAEERAKAEEEARRREEKEREERRLEEERIAKEREAQLAKEREAEEARARERAAQEEELRKQREARLAERQKELDAIAERNRREEEALSRHSAVPPPASAASRGWESRSGSRSGSQDPRFADLGRRSNSGRDTPSSGGRYVPPSARGSSGAGTHRAPSGPPSTGSGAGTYRAPSGLSSRGSGTGAYRAPSGPPTTGGGALHSGPAPERKRLQLQPRTKPLPDQNK